MVRIILNAFWTAVLSAALVPLPQAVAGDLSARLSREVQAYQAESGGQVGVSVRRLSDGAEVFTSSGHELFAPAS
jgi:hypothetical protein